MATPYFDRIAEEFVKRVPTAFKTAFTPGGGVMPDTYALTASVISGYVNRAILKLFNDTWVATEGDVDKFVSIFPELISFSGELSLTAGEYVLTNPHLDFKALISAHTNGDKYIRIWKPSFYSSAVSGRYPSHEPTADKPAMIHMANKLVVFPKDSTFKIEIQYIKMPLLPSTGGLLIQNGAVDSPYDPAWNSRIADIAEQMYLVDSSQTT